MATYQGKSLVMADDNGQPGRQLGTLSDDVEYDKREGLLPLTSGIIRLLGHGFGRKYFHLILEGEGNRLARCRIWRTGFIDGGNNCLFEHEGILPTRRK